MCCEQKKYEKDTAATAPQKAALQRTFIFMLLYLYFSQKKYEKDTAATTPPQAALQLTFISILLYLDFSQKKYENMKNTQEGNLLLPPYRPRCN